jgi:periplasmic divalent cation tolerance protein
MDKSYLFILSTCPDKECAESLAQLLVKSHLAACVNIVPGLTSVYHWQGAVEMASEHLLVIKTESARYTEVETCLRANHPYELPEILAFSVSQGSSDYLHWISQWLGSS